MTPDEQAAYWLESANHDFAAMESLFANGHYVWALFVGHLVVEKLLKAYHGKKTSTPGPKGP